MKTRLLTLPLAMTFLAEFTALTSFFLLLSAMPMLAAAHGAGNAGAGMVTGSLLLGTVVAEIVAASLIGRLGYRAVLAAGATLLGVPVLALLTRQPQAVLAGISLVRGLGFGLCGVATGALTATLIPADRRGEGLGLLGIVAGVPAIVALPAGVWLAGHHNAVMITALALVTGLMPLTGLRWLPGGRPERRPRPERSGGGALRVPLIFAASTVAAGVVDSFLPLAHGVPSSLSSAALLVQAIAATISRWQAGRHGDRYGHDRMLVPALAVAAVGMVALTWLASPAMIFAGMLLFGAGFGVVENATFALLLDQQPEARASARWNLAYDAGYGVGPVVFGLFSGGIGYSAAFGLTALVIVAALPLTGCRPRGWSARRG